MSMSSLGLASERASERTRANVPPHCSRWMKGPTGRYRDFHSSPPTTLGSAPIAKPSHWAHEGRSTIALLYSMAVQGEGKGREERAGGSAERVQTSSQELGPSQYRVGREMRADAGKKLLPAGNALSLALFLAPLRGADRRMTATPTHPQRR